MAMKSMGKKDRLIINMAKLGCFLFSEGTIDSGSFALDDSRGDSVTANRIACGYNGALAGGIDFQGAAY
jgi:hypothetical protein